MKAIVTRPESEISRCPSSSLILQRTRNWVTSRLDTFGVELLVNWMSLEDLTRIVSTMACQVWNQMTTLYIMIICSGSNVHDSPHGAWSHWPEAEDLQRAKTRLGAAEINLKVIIIGTALTNQIPPESVIKDYPPEVEIPPYPLRKYNRSVTEGDRVREIRRTSMPVIFLDYTGTKTSYDLMEILETATTEKRWYLNLRPGPDVARVPKASPPRTGGTALTVETRSDQRSPSWAVVKIDRLVTEWMRDCLDAPIDLNPAPPMGGARGGHPALRSRESPRDAPPVDSGPRLLYPTYDIYSGERLKGDFRGGFGGAEFKEILGRLILMCRIVENYIRSGFDENQSLQVPEPWTLNLHTYTLAGLIRAYQLYPKANDKDINYEIAGNPQYRQVITQSLVHVLGAFTINNGIMPLPDVVQNGGWYSIRLWPKIRLILEKWIIADFKTISS